MSLNIKGNIISSTDITSVGVFKSKVNRDGLVCYLDAANLDSYVGSGTSWVDMSGSGLNGTLQAGVTYSSSNTGVLSFDTTANAYIQFASSSIFAFGTGDFTLEMWIYPTSLASYHHMFDLPDQNTFGLKSEVTTGLIYFYSAAFNTYGSTAGWTLAINTWNHVCLVRRDSIAYPYLNAVIKGAVAGFTNNFTTQALNIGNGWPGEKPARQVSQARIYNRGLNPFEIAENFQATRGRFGI